MAFEGRFLREATGAHLVEALDWVGSRADKPDGALETLIGGVFGAAARHLPEDGVAAALARAMVARVRPKAYVLSSPGASDVQAALREQAVDDRVRLADAVAASVVSALDCYELDRWVASLELPYDEVLKRVTTASGAALTFWTEVVAVDPRTRSGPVYQDAILRIVEVMGDSSAKERLTAIIRPTTAGCAATEREQ